MTSESPPPRRDQHTRLADTALASLPAVVAFLMIPFAIYLPNQRDFDFNLLTVAPFVGLATLWLAMVALVAWRKPRWAARLGAPLFFVGVFLCLSDILAPVSLGAFTGEVKTEIPEPPALVLVEILLACGLVVCARRVPRASSRRFGAPLVAILIVCEIFVVASGLSPETHLGTRRPPAQPLPESPPVDGGNVYHFLLDGFSGPAFRRALTHLDTADSFDGFIHFPNAYSNYLGTVMSLSSTLTGTFYRGGRLQDWWQTAREGGVARAAHDSGYVVHSYQTYSDLGPGFASRTRVLKDFAADKKSRVYSLFFADLWLIRVLPVILQSEVYAEGKGLVFRLADESSTDWQSKRVLASVDFMRRIVGDERSRPDRGQYVFAHVLLPHGPNAVDEECRPVEESSDLAQATCTVQLLSQFLAELRKTGRFHDSTILVHSDHGLWWSPTPEDSDLLATADEGGSRLLPLWQQSYLADSLKTLLTRAHSLVLIKPSGAPGRPLETVPTRVQMVDLAPTLAALMNWELPGAAGRSIVSEDYPEDRQVDFFVGYFLRLDGLVRQAHLESPRGVYQHVSYGPRRGWRLETPVEYRY